ncbi:MAG: hypothetical protein E6235_07055 [Anaerococcus vaginalis]|uniref:hypothetical protein n=1 Tax=Anaerococcus vaginalis TaxID=33037 RepID=UPI00290C7E42|nr:hypothetical protein [Anaerococcus vaginalis]MDU5086794.1 hypothetical protein [Anaerococcus vaginalis]
MKTKEFIKRVEELGFEVSEEYDYIRICVCNYIIATLSESRLYCINTYNSVKVEWVNEKKLFDLLVEYAKTPIEDRKEEKRFFLRHKYINKRNAYLVVDENQNCSLQVMGVDYELPTSDKAKFTEREIENIKDYNKTDLHDFEMIEVEI